MFNLCSISVTIKFRKTSKKKRKKKNLGRLQKIEVVKKTLGCV